MKCTHCNGTGVLKTKTKNKIEELFDSIISVLDSPRTKLTAGRANKLKLRLKTFTEEEILTAGKQLSKSAWHMGDNPNNMKYATIDFLIRNDEQVDKWLNTETKTEMQYA